MICIFCSAPLDTINSRPQKSRNQVWRRRKCLGCGFKYTTGEQIDLSKAICVNNQPFSRDKLFISIYNACRHRPTAAQDAGGLMDTIIGRLLVAKVSITSDRIVAITVPVLKRFDVAAAVQYKAFHKR